MRLLVIEDEEDLVHALAKGLRKEGYAVDIATDGQEGWSLAQINRYDLVILDLNLPELDGLEILRYLREKSSDVKILILTARTEIDDRVKGLDLGANDYLIKPFHFKELKARIRALLRRKFISQEPVLECGPLKIDTVKHEAWCNGSLLKLTRKEFAMLKYLTFHAGNVVSQEELLEHIWDEAVNPFTNVVRVHINSLRRKLDECMPNSNFLIETIPGVGYRINTELNDRHSLKNVEE